MRGRHTRLSSLVTPMQTGDFWGPTPQDIYSWQFTGSRAARGWDLTCTMCSQGDVAFKGSIKARSTWLRKELLALYLHSICPRKKDCWLPSGSKQSKPHEPERRRWTDPAGKSDNTVSNTLAMCMPFSPEGPSEGYVQTKVHKDVLHRCFVTFAVSSDGIKQKHLDASH